MTLKNRVDLLEKKIGVLKIPDQDLLRINNRMDEDEALEIINEVLGKHFELVKANPFELARVLSRAPYKVRNMIQSEIEKIVAENAVHLGELRENEIR